VFNTKVLALWLLPPLNFLIAALTGFLLLKRKPVLGRWILGISLLLLWIFSMHIVGGSLLGRIERGAHTPIGQMKSAQAIVVLGGGLYFDTPEYGGDTVGGSTLERLRYAATIARKTNLPVLVTGGAGWAGGSPVAAHMKQVLEQEFSVPVKWRETASRNTRENALYSAKILQPEGVRTIVLVTHAVHMPRARQLFEQAGLQVIPAGTAFRGNVYFSWRGFLPSLAGLNASAGYFYETLGAWWNGL
jgi:uncharacterized SAM-binding protein YcdF (DUF218 family)